jgi:hypothetical protein
MDNGRNAYAFDLRICGFLLIEHCTKLTFCITRSGYPANMKLFAVAALVLLLAGMRCFGKLRRALQLAMNTFRMMLLI